MGRLDDKLQQAASVVGRVTAKIEARADAIIARENALDAKTDAAFGPHETILTETEKGLDAVESKLALLDNGAPLASSTDSTTGQTPTSTVTSQARMPPGLTRGGIDFKG